MANPFYNEKRRGSHGNISKRAILDLFNLTDHSFLCSDCKNFMGFNARKPVLSSADHLVCELGYRKLWSCLRDNCNPFVHRSMALDEKTEIGLQIFLTKLSKVQFA